MSVSGETFASWATHVTRCSNPTFNRVTNKLWDNPKLQKNVLAVLTGVTKLIQSRGGSESGAEYFAALLSLLNTETSTKDAEAYLLCLVISKAVPVSLLRKSCGEVTKTITNILSGSLQTEPPDVTMCKSLILALGRVLNAQPSENWSLESVRHTFRIFIQLIDHDHATIRKSVHKVISEIIASTFCRENSFHPVCHQTVNYTTQKIRQEFARVSSLIRITDTECGRLLYNMNLLKTVICLVPAKDVKDACECILELTALNNPTVVKTSFECIQSLFEGRLKYSSLPLEMAGKLMTALLTCKPTVLYSVDSSVVEKVSGNIVAWLKCLQAGVNYLTTLVTDKPEGSSFEIASTVAMEHLEHLIRISINIIINNSSTNLRHNAMQMVISLLENQLISQLQTCELLLKRPRFLPEFCLSLQNALNLARRETWPSLLNISSHLMHVWATAVARGESTDLALPDEVTSMLNRVANLRDALVDGAEGVVDSLGVNVTTLIDEMNRLILTSMESWGIEAVIRDALSLEPILTDLESGSVELRRSWILPLICRVQPAYPCSLAFFHASILPLADRAIAVANAAANQTLRRQVGGNRGTFVPLTAILNAAVETARQLWSTLAIFTRQPPSRWPDLLDSGLGGRLVAGLLTSKAIRPVILLALRHLVSFADTEEAVAVMRAGAKNIVPRILSMYEEQDQTNDQQLKQQFETTLSVLLPLLTPKMLSVPFELSYKKLITTNKPIYMEILILIVPNLTSENIADALKQLEKYFTPRGCESRVLRKLAYRLLEAVVTCSTPTAKEFVATNLSSLVAFMHQIAPPTGTAVVDLSEKEQKALLTLTPWKSRLRILRLLLRALVERQLEDSAAASGDTVEAFINTFLPEVPACLGSLNSLVRVVAGRLLADMAQANALIGPSETNADAFKGRSRAAPSLMSQGVEEGNTVNWEDEGSIDSEHSRAPTEVASVSTVITTSGLDPVVAGKICAGLKNILCRLWPLLLEATPESVKSSTPAQMIRLEVTAKSVCRLLSDLRLRGALMTDLQVAAEEGQTDGDAAAIVSHANLAAGTLVQLPNKQLARLGLQISRLLVAFIGYSVFVSDIVTCIQQVNKAHKRALRFVVKAIIEKLLKKVSVHALQSIMNTEYHKMIRNSVKIQLRKERKKKTDRKRSDDGDKSSDSENSNRTGRASSTSGATIKSVNSLCSALSLLKPIHIQNFNELLADSSEEDNKTDAPMEKLETPLEKNRPNALPRRKGLATELERAASVAGLCRKSARSLGFQDDEESSSDEDLTHQVRFADKKQPTGSSRKRGRSDAELEPLTFLVEDAGEEVLDLADPEALARHLTVASSASLARRTLVSQRDGDSGLVAGKSKRARLTSLSCSTTFPTTADGKFVINDANMAQPESENWRLGDEIGDMSAQSPPALFSSSSSLSNATKSKPTKSDGGRQLLGSVYRSARAHGDMKKPGLPDPFAYIPLGAAAGISTKSLGGGGKRKRSGRLKETERRALIRCLGFGKQKRNTTKRTHVAKKFDRNQKYREKNQHH